MNFIRRIILINLRFQPMEKLKLLFTKDGLQYQILKNKSVLEEQSFLPAPDQEIFSVSEKLDEVLAKKDFTRK
jgi:hypothetical protein